MSERERCRYEQVEGVRFGRYNLGLNTTCIVYRIGDTIIDTGPPNQWRHVRRFLRERAVRHVLVTHHHEDHGGNGRHIQRELDAPVLAPSKALAAMRSGWSQPLIQKIVWGRPTTLEAEPLPEEIALADGLRLRPLAAPGHAPDMTCFLEPDRGWLFSGDLYLAAKTRYMRWDEVLPELMASLRKVLALDFGAMFCAHRGIVHDGRAAVARKLDFLENLCGEARAQRRAGRSVREITRSLLGREDIIAYLSGFTFSKRLLIEAALQADGEPPPAC